MVAVSVFEVSRVPGDGAPHAVRMHVPSTATNRPNHPVKRTAAGRRNGCSMTTPDAPVRLCCGNTHGRADQRPTRSDGMLAMLPRDGMCGCWSGAEPGCGAAQLRRERSRAAPTRASGDWAVANRHGKESAQPTRMRRSSGCSDDADRRRLTSGTRSVARWNAPCGRHWSRAWVTFGGCAATQSLLADQGW